MGSKKKTKFGTFICISVEKQRAPVGWIELIRKEKYCHQKKAKEKREKKNKNLEASR